MRLPGKVVFITDADLSSGKAVLLRLAAEGASFILNSASAGRELGPELELARQTGANVLVVTADLSRSDEAARVLETAAERLGTVDVLVHNNNLVKPIRVEDGDEALFLEMMNANAKTAYVCAKAAGEQMKAKRAGKIIFVSSIHAEKPTGSSFAYSASKGAVKMLAREAAVVLGRHGVSVNTIEFGPAEGDDAVFSSDVSGLYEHYRYKVPGAVLGTHKDLAELVLFLASDEARCINGADIRMDGGFLMHYLDFKMNMPLPAGGAL
ncbi:SDR family NAD(P)-dependent oxidoreductase [Paenibacillus humicola]|uniref:SDR family NAD(P)-dependent oxidoreductase n=1 Tax=Paenibacillus humicola TaxID=3110540 RepID=UPI00237ABFD5|nr:SDR family oxidoreductase [Paenibacillus humicola]